MRSPTIGDHKLAIFSLDGALETAVSRVVLEQVDHVFEIDERIIDSDNVNSALFNSCACNQTSDTSESENWRLSKRLLPKGREESRVLPVDSNLWLRHHDLDDRSKKMSEVYCE